MAGQEIPRDAGQPAGVADRRSMLDGDVAPVHPPAAITEFVARGATEAARAKQEGALTDMLAAMVPERAKELSDALRAVMAGAHRPTTPRRSERPCSIALCSPRVRCRRTTN
jgi:hypothetical protein